MRPGHARAASGPVRAARFRRADVLAGRHHIRDIRARIGLRRPTAGKIANSTGEDGSVIYRAGSEDAPVVAGGTQGATGRPFVASRSFDQDAGRLQGCDFVFELERIAARRAPRIIDCVRGLGRVGIAAGQIPGRQVPFEALGDGGIGARAAIVQALAVNGLCARGHADLIAGTIVADHRAGGVRAVAVAVVGRVRIGAGRVPPIVVVIGRGTIPTPVVRFNSRVLPIQPGVAAGQDNARAGVPGGPHIVGVDEGEVRLNRQNTDLRVRRHSGGGQLIGVIRRDAGHVGAGRQRVYQRRVSAAHQDFVGDVEGLVLCPPTIQISAQWPLGARGSIAQRLQDQLAFRRARREPGRLVQIRLFHHPHEEIGLPGGFELLKYQTLDFSLRGFIACRGSLCQADADPT